MAKKKQTKKNNKTITILTAIAIVLFIAIAIVFGIMYFNTNKKLKDANVDYSEITLSENSITFDLFVDGDIKYYDIYAVGNNKEIILAENIEILKENNTYTYTLTNGSWEIKVIMYNDVLGFLEIKREIIIGNVVIKSEESEMAEGVMYDDFQIHFLELGNHNTGDSTYIKAGNLDILIDAGSRGSSAETINSYVKNYCEDGVLEYVIATHNHQDHIAGFAGVNGTSKTTNFKGEKVDKTGVLYYYDVETFIDFTYAEITVNKNTITVENKTQVSSDYSSGTEYGKYLAAREYMISNGTTYYCVKDLFESNKTSFDLGNGIVMDILYNYYYFNQSSDVNNYSICTMFSYNNHHYLLTGDLEKDGEEKLAAYYDSSTPEKTLPHCDLFKAGHHGSPTSSNDCLLSKITPDMCCVCCCAGDSEYTANYNNQFPSQEFINRIAVYTDKVYVTTYYDEVEKTFKSLNGNIVVSSNGDEIGLSASNNLTKLKDSNWFNETIYVDSSGNNVPQKKSEDYYTADTAGVSAVQRRVWP